MKKLQKTLPALMLVLMLALTGLSGCQLFPNQQPEQGDIDHAPRDRRIGVIQSLGSVKTNNQGTNLLIMDDGTTILLKSLAINLDDAKYAAKKVEVSGLLTYTTGDNKQIMEVESIDVLDDVPVTTQQAAVVTWRDYVNAGLGFSVKYRDDFTVDESGQLATFTRPVGPDAVLMTGSQETSTTMEMPVSHTITISATPHDSSKTLLKDVLKLADDNASTLLAADISKSKIGGGGINAYKRVFPEKQSVSFYFDADGKFYEVSYQGGADSQSVEDQNVFYNFLGSFQLLNGSPATQQTKENDTVNNDLQGSTPGSVGKAITTSAEDFESAADTTTADSSTTSTPAAPPTSSDSTTVSNPPSTGATQEALPGYSTFTSTGYKFSLQYPKSWYFGQTTTTESGVVRRYDFGTKPVDEQPGVVNLDIVSGSMPSGTTYTVGDKTVMKTSSGDTTSYYYKGVNGRLYRVSGPSGMDSSLRNMMETLQEQ